MTLEQIAHEKKAFLTAEEVKDVLGCDAHYIRVQAHIKPADLGFPVIVLRSRVKIPRLPFLQFMTCYAPKGGGNIYAARREG